MKDLFKNKSLYLIGLVLVILIAAIIFTVSRIGGAYQNGISQLTDQKAPTNATHTVKLKINKITVKNAGDKGCVEVTPDGIVRTYDVCGSQLSGANRMMDASNINRLFKLAGETDFTKAQETAVSDCAGYVMTIETEAGKKSICMGNQKSGSGSGNSGSNTGSGGNGGSGGNNPIGEIVDTIIKIIEDIPPTPTITHMPGTPAPTIEITGTPQPTIPFLPEDLPTPTPTPILLKPFTCGYTVDANGKKRPYNVSNIICSDLPVAGQ
jgi:hypothetical protein